MSIIRARTAATLGIALGCAATAFSQAPAAPGLTADSFRGSVAHGQAVAQSMDISLDQAIQLSLQNNLGVILSGTQSASARAERLSQLQSLLPTINATGSANVVQSDLAAIGLRFPGINPILGPFGYADVRASLKWSLVDLGALDKYFAARHNFAAAQLSAQDAREMVILTSGNAYLLVLADQALVVSLDSQAATAQLSLDQAQDSHDAGTAPLIDVLRARVDLQSVQQKSIAAKAAVEKDKLALVRVIGLPVAQSIHLSDPEPYAEFDAVDAPALIDQAEKNRKDLAALVEQAQAAAEQRKAATAERYPTLTADVDYGDIGITLGHSHGTVDATGKLSVPVFKEFSLRGDAEQSQAQLDTAQAQVSDKRAQIEADVRDALLDIDSSQKQVAVARSSVELATEELKESQDRYAAGVSDNLGVSQAQQSLAQANDQLVASIYRHNVAKLSLARALGTADDYNRFLANKH